MRKVFFTSLLAMLTIFVFESTPSLANSHDTFEANFTVGNQTISAVISNHCDITFVSELDNSTLSVTADEQFQFAYENDIDDVLDTRSFDPAVHTGGTINAIYDASTLTANLDDALRVVFGSTPSLANSHDTFEANFTVGNQTISAVISNHCDITFVSELDNSTLSVTADEQFQFAYENDIDDVLDTRSFDPAVHTGGTINAIYDASTLTANLDDALRVVFGNTPSLANNSNSCVNIRVSPAGNISDCVNPSTVIVTSVEPQVRTLNGTVYNWYLTTSGFYVAGSVIGLPGPTGQIPTSTTDTPEFCTTSGSLGASYEVVIPQGQSLEWSGGHARIETTPNGTVIADAQWNNDLVIVAIHNRDNAGSLSVHFSNMSAGNTQYCLGTFSDQWLNAQGGDRRIFWDTAVDGR